MNLVYLLGFQPNKGFALFGVSDEKYHVRGGNQQIPNAIANDLGDQVITGHSLVRLAQTSGGRYTCTFDRANGSVDVTADYVVLAIPFAVLAGVDYVARRLRRAEDDRDPTSSDAATTASSRSSSPIAAGTAPARGPASRTARRTRIPAIRASWDVTRAQPGTPGILVLYGGGSVTDAMKTTSPFATATDAGVQKDVKNGLHQLAPVYPGLNWNGKATQSLPHKSPFFNLAYSYWKVGQYTQFSGYEAATQGGVFFCGEHTSTDFQGYMEGGASTGKDTAKALTSLL